MRGLGSWELCCTLRCLLPPRTPPFNQPTKKTKKTKSNNRNKVNHNSHQNPPTPPPRTSQLPPDHSTSSHPYTTPSVAQHGGPSSFCPLSIVGRMEGGGGGIGLGLICFVRGSFILYRLLRPILIHLAPVGRLVRSRCSFTSQCASEWRNIMPEEGIDPRPRSQVVGGLSSLGEAREDGE